jgi:hypothetical protein
MPCRWLLLDEAVPAYYSSLIVGCQFRMMVPEAMAQSYMNVPLVAQYQELVARGERWGERYSRR